MIRLTRRHALVTGMAMLAAPAVGRPAVPALRIGAILPLGGRGLPEAGVNLSVPAEAARKGLVLAHDDLDRAAGVDGTHPILLLANAPEAGSARRAAERLVERDGATVLIGGFGTDDAQAIAAVAAEADALFINIGAPADHLRGANCGVPVLHIEAPASRYLAALADLHGGLGRRHWHLVHQDDADGRALAAQMQAEIAARPDHSCVGTSIVSADPASLPQALARVDTGRAGIVLFLTDWMMQLHGLALAESRGMAAPVTGFPAMAAQTRTFLNRARQWAPRAALGERVALWEPLATTPEAAARSADFLARWREPMDAPAWAAQTAFRLAAAAAAATGSTSGANLARWLSDPDHPLSIDKDALGRVRPADGQLSQLLYALRINPAATTATTPEAMMARAILIGTLPDPMPAATVVDGAACPRRTAIETSERTGS